jgi:hypothetical protein
VTKSSEGKGSPRLPASEPARRARQTCGPQHKAKDAAPLARPAGYGWQRRARGWRLGPNAGKSAIACSRTTGGSGEPNGVGSAARRDRTVGKGGTSRGSPRRSRTAKAGCISAGPVKSPRACETGGWGRSKRRWVETAQLGPEPSTAGVSGAPCAEDPSGLPFGARFRSPRGSGSRGVREGGPKLSPGRGMLGTCLTRRPLGKAPSDRLALKPYWREPDVRKYTGGGGDVGIIRRPVRATPSPDRKSGDP